ncbi:Hsp20/alpha crystallin family protein [Sulfuricurvum sp.]|uniref:Hsp20/alpha crystallin family protein n=1 Tax=Sulfuricurvum sp. TaxID=2025608 RepID=UPI0019BC7634|nr:Hsp20/alpha crystallin family protein [Sulfuricurvum sp.]MBD3799354.1 Hsp20/alpha crystallin family protein [Campylobacterota bacterium]MBD3806629.1 Hsp20/alpha crystallin family protein [Sulfuricurvum sp.]
MALSKSVLVLLGAVPLMAAVWASTPQQKTDKPCDERCVFWNMDDMMERFFERSYPRMFNAYSASSMKENNKAYLISIDLPGIDKKDISIETSGNRLIVSGERKEETQNKEGSKKSYRQFHQSFTLPDDANLETISATSANGVLKITVPKTGKKVSKKIEIQ